MARQVPKNVRQIGNVSDSSKVYIEDYVETFLNQLCERADSEMLGAFLVGEKVQEEENDYIYVCGAIHMQKIDARGKDIIIEENMWKKACETCKEYFGNAEILGWFIAGEETPVEADHSICKIHQKYFPREQSLFVTKGNREKEEKYYIYKYQEMMECQGHYIYYEKNSEMQNYMVSTRKEMGITPSELVEDRAAKSFRNLVQQKLQKEEARGNNRWVYAASTFLVLLVLVMGAGALNNYEKMKNAQEEMNEIVQNNHIQDDLDGETVETLGPVTNQEENKPVELEGNDVEPEDTENGEGDSETSSGLQMEEIYVVEKGDTLASISKKVYGNITRVEDICELNGLDDGNLIFIGQKLLLP